MLEAIDVHRMYGSTPVLRGIDLAVEAGEWVALMGPSGCGKSTLLHLLAGLDRPDAGRITIAGETLHDRTATARADIRRRRIGIVFQSANLLPHLDVRTNVELAGRLGGLRRGTARERTSTLLHDLGLGHRLLAAPHHLSGGEQQRTAIARALINKPAVLLADEPTGSLDSAATDNVLDLFRQIHEAGQTIVMVTHDHRVAARADRVVRLRDGKVLDTDDRHALRAELAAVAASLQRPDFDADGFGPSASFGSDDGDVW